VRPKYRAVRNSYKYGAILPAERERVTGSSLFKSSDGACFTCPCDIPSRPITSRTWRITKLRRRERQPGQPKHGQPEPVFSYCFKYYLPHRSASPITVAAQTISHTVLICRLGRVFQIFERINWCATVDHADPLLSMQLFELW